MFNITSKRIEDLEEIARNTRKDILRMVRFSNSSHVGSSLSTVELLTTLYFEVLNVDPKNPDWSDRDRFILSKGHASAALYSIMAEKGFFSKELLDKYYIDGGELPGHLDCHATPGVEASTGSLGHGLPIGVGISIAAKHDKAPYRTFVLLSDGECDEGSVWESAMLASQLKLDNLIAIIDYNKIQSFGRIKDVIDLEPFSEKWESFGWKAIEVDGHNIAELTGVLKNIPIEQGKPTAVIAHTIKGKGVSFMEDKLEWHYKSPNQEEYEIAIKEIESI